MDAIRAGGVEEVSGGLLRDRGVPGDLWLAEFVQGAGQSWRAGVSAGGVVGGDLEVVGDGVGR